MIGMLGEISNNNPPNKAGLKAKKIKRVQMGVYGFPHIHFSEDIKSGI